MALGFLDGSLETGTFHSSQLGKMIMNTFGNSNKANVPLDALWVMHQLKSCLCMEGLRAILIRFPQMQLN